MSVSEIKWREPEDIMDPRHYEGVRRPFETAETLPAWSYTSQAFYEREVARIFKKYWNCLGHESLLPEPGTYVTTDFVDVPLVLTRGQNGKVHAFINSCAHRGSRVIDGSGKRNVLTCPYHNWSYNLEGALIGTPMFAESDAFR